MGLKGALAEVTACSIEAPVARSRLVPLRSRYGRVAIDPAGSATSSDHCSWRRS